jgi:hypothetical protein
MTFSASLAFFLQTRYNNDDLRLLNRELNAADANGESAVLVYRKPPVRPGVPKSFSDESLMVYKNLLG